MADGPIGVCDRKGTSMFDHNCLNQDKSSCACALSSWQKAAHAILTLHVRFFSSHVLPFAMDLKWKWSLSSDAVRLRRFR